MALNMDDETHLPVKPFLAVAIAPVVVFVLGNALLLPLLSALEISRGGFLADLIRSSGNPYIQDLILIIAGFCCLPFSAFVVLAGPPLTSFLANRKYPVFTDRFRAILGGGIFLGLNSILVIIVLVLRRIDGFQSLWEGLVILQVKSPFHVTMGLQRIISYFLDPLPCLLAFAGMALSGSVGLAGWYGARHGRRKLDATRVI
jgi:hypothetical protein